MAFKNSKAKLEFWVKNKQNVLFVGRHGVGKTAIVKDTFYGLNLNYRYFSAATMDPWVDFIGIPREKVKDEYPEDFRIIRELACIDFSIAAEWVMSNWKLSENNARRIVEHALNRKEPMNYLDLLRPEVFADGSIQALFFDEFNRSHKKTRNAVMELIQFGSINGHRLPNLLCVWAAINSEEDPELSYDVEKLDPAQLDRFHVCVEMDYKPNKSWFTNKYGKKVADAAIEWWGELTPELQNLVSPRRLEYALNAHDINGDIRDVLPEDCNVAKLISALETGSVVERLEYFMRDNKVEEARAFLANDNQCTSAMKHIILVKTLLDWFAKLLPKEKISKYMAENDDFSKYVIENSKDVSDFYSVCRQIVDAGTNPVLAKRIRKSLQENKDMQDKWKDHEKREKEKQQ